MILSTDYHCHLLPNIDDGSKSAATTKEMAERLLSQGIKKVYATPHFYAHRISAEDFMEKRQASFESIKNIIPEGIEIVLGAEVALERGIFDIPLLKELSLGNTGYILLELPFANSPYWIEEEVYNITHENSLRPVFAHIERYFPIYKDSVMKNILSFENAVYQFSNNSLKYMSIRRKVKRMLDEGYHIIFGSDAHDCDFCPPNFDLVDKYMPKLLNNINYYSLNEL